MKDKIQRAPVAIQDIKQPKHKIWIINSTAIKYTVKSIPILVRINIIFARFFEVKQEQILFAKLGNSINDDINKKARYATTPKRAIGTGPISLYSL
tara:strand:+ start:1927 stop:2214 length:288 start_codon:yes stop_codon:yes gene_type:complete